MIKIDRTRTQKQKEQEVLKTGNMYAALEMQILTMESAAMNLNVFKAQKEAATVQKAMRGDLDADDVEDTMDAIQEERDIADQVTPCS